MLYKNGIGYFEHVGSIRDNQQVAIAFNTSQLNDVLKSLTVLDLGGGRITGVNYGSGTPLERSLQDLRLGLGEAASLPDFWAALRGARIDIRNSSKGLAGRVLSTERKVRTKGELTIEADYITLVTDHGEVRTVEVMPATSISILDRDLAGRFDKYLGLIAAARSSVQRRLVISTSGAGERSLMVSYISEVPVWKTTYRLVLSSKPGEAPLLQGWAIVDNTIGEDWQNVALSLVAGAPQSFIQTLSEPYFSRRPVVGVPQAAESVPQVHESVLLTEPASAPVAANVNDKLPRELEPSYLAFASARAPRTDGSGSALGSGANLGLPAAGTGGGVGSGSGMGGGAFRIGSGQPPPVLPRQLGDLFEYKLEQPVTILRNQSALTPIIHASVSAEKVSLWNDNARLTRPLRALWVTNTSGATLDNGSFSVLEDGTFAGEGLMDSLRAGEKRILSYAVDLAVTASSRLDRPPHRVSQVKINRGIMTQKRETREARTYTFRNEDTNARTIIVEHPIRPGYQIRGAVKPFETTPAWMRFRVPVASKQTATLVVEESNPHEVTFNLSRIDANQVALFIEDSATNKQIEEALRGILAQKEIVRGLDADFKAVTTEMSRIYDDQQRLRENLKSLKGSAEEKALTQRYTQQLNDQETRLEALRVESKGQEARLAEAGAKLEKMTNDLVMDVVL